VVAVEAANMNLTTLTVFLSLPQKYKKQINISNGNRHFIYDVSNKRIMGVSDNTHAINKICDSFLNTNSFLHANTCVLDDGFDSLSPYLYCIDEDNNTIVKSTDILNFDDLYYYALISEKTAAVNYVVITIANFRRRIYANTLLQHEIYQYKLKEAEEIINLNIDELSDGTEQQYPFVYGYAQVENLSLRVAANEIKLRHEFFYKKLANIETFRLKFIKQIIECKDITMIPIIVDDIETQGSLYGKF